MAHLLCGCAQRICRSLAECLASLSVISAPAWDGSLSKTRQRGAGGRASTVLKPFDEYTRWLPVRRKSSAATVRGQQHRTGTDHRMTSFRYSHVYAMPFTPAPCPLVSLAGATQPPSLVIVLIIIKRGRPGPHQRKSLLGSFRGSFRRSLRSGFHIHIFRATGQGKTNQQNQGCTQHFMLILQAPEAPESVSFPSTLLKNAGFSIFVSSIDPTGSWHLQPIRHTPVVALRYRASSFAALRSWLVGTCHDPGR